MELTGKIVQVLPIQSGMNKKGGGWMKQEFILDLGGQYPKSVCMSIWGQDKVEKYDLEEGLTVTAHIELESREYQGRWYTDVKAWKVEWDSNQRRQWQPGSKPGDAKQQGDALKGTAAFSDAEDTSMRGHNEGPADLGSGPLSDDLPF